MTSAQVVHPPPSAQPLQAASPQVMTHLETPSNVPEASNPGLVRPGQQGSGEAGYPDLGIDPMIDWAFQAVDDVFLPAKLPATRGR
jgi:hypothetical protein